MATHSFTCKQAIPAFTSQPQSITACAAGTHFAVPCRVEGSLDLGGWLHTEYGSRTRTWSPIPLLTGLNVGQPCWSRPTRYNYAKPPPLKMEIINFIDIVSLVSTIGNYNVALLGRCGLYCYKWNSAVAVCRSACTILNPAKTAEPIEMPFGLWTRVAQGSMY